MLAFQLFIIFTVLCKESHAIATPECYSSAAIPAHEYVFSDSKAEMELTGLSEDGQSCRQIVIWEGKPLYMKPIYVPFSALYNSYARAVESKNVAALKKLYAYVQPTPRSFSNWLWLANDAQDMPQPWGMQMAVRLVELLQPHPSILKELLSSDDQYGKVLNLSLAWPTLFFLMRGEMYPDGKWIKSVLSYRAVTRLLSWRYPCYLPEQKIEKNAENKKETWLLLP